MKSFTEELAALPQVADNLLAYAGKQRIILLEGEIGAGKTTLVKAIGQQLGILQAVTSPTFSIINEYTYLDANGREHPFYHMDLYRLKQESEAVDIGIEDYLYSGHYCLIEWPRVIASLLPLDVVQVQITIANN
ncbi:MAG: tRNA (adenosine(37)-N6)-threonylcarbamoyltransferase complex ATPase subunit type 1 TsaE, partial [Bacteroidota bacterium]